MKRLSRGFSLASLCLTLAACGSAKYYTLPTDPSMVSQTQTMIGACATESGLESYKNEDLVVVKYDNTATLYYTYAGDDSFRLQISLDDKLVAPADLEKKHSVVKAKGDEVYACAQTRLYGPPPSQTQVIVVPAAQQPSTGMSFEMKANPTGMTVSMNAPTAGATVGGSCAQALECYSQLSRTVCANSTGNCSFKAEISGNDEEGCRNALLQVPQLLQPFKMQRPGLSAPPVCDVP